MSKNATTSPTDAQTTEQEHRIGVSRDERQQMLLDDLQVEVGRLADAVERQNELLEELNTARGEVADD